MNQKVKFWERLPLWFFYLPVFFLSVKTAWQLKSLTWFTTVNQGMHYSGLINSSKWDVLSKLAKNLIPVTCFCRQQPTIAGLKNIMQDFNLGFPLVFKPDRGERGDGVKVVGSLSQAEQYLNKGDYPLLIQQFVNTAKEFGVMVAKRPGEEFFSITSVFERVFPQVTGDGRRTLKQLVAVHPRAGFYLKKIAAFYDSKIWQQPVARGHSFLLHNIGSHSRGVCFINRNDLAGAELHEIFNRLCRPLADIRLGRFDLKCQSDQHLLRGELKVLEFNGINAEPGHIYDPNNTLWNAWRDLTDHWRLVGRIAADQIKNGCKPKSVKQFLMELKHHKILKKRRALL